MPFSVYLRGRTEGGYSDSKCLVVAETKLDPTAIIISVTIALIILIVLIAVIFVLYRRQIG